MLPDSELDLIAAGFEGRIGFYIKDLSSGAVRAYAASERFPTASVIKLPVLVELFRQVEHGSITLRERRRLHGNVSRLFASGALRLFEDEPELTINDFARAMIAVSDDMAAEMIMESCGIARTGLE